MPIGRIAAIRHSTSPASGTRPGRASRLRVKTTSNGEPCWTAKKNGLFLEIQKQDDFVVICDIKNGVRGASVYVVPTCLVEEHLIRNHAE
jgi:hypothetical protein